MKSNMKRIAALVMAVLLVLSMMPGAMAAEYYSGSLSVGGRVKKPTPQPTEAPVVETPAPEQPEEPVVEEPVIEEPVVEEPVVEEPVVEEPVVEEPTVEEPAEEAAPETVFAVVYKTGDDPAAMIREAADAESKRIGKAYHGDVVTVLGEENGWYNVDANGTIGWISGKLLSFDMSVIETPETDVEEEVVEEPVVEEPVVEEPVVEEPVVEELVVEEPVIEEPVVEEPVVEELVVEEPVVEELVVEEPVIEEPVIEEPVVEEPVVEEPVIEETEASPSEVVEETEASPSEATDGLEEIGRLVLPLMNEGETELNVYAEQNAESEVIALIPVGQMVRVLEIGETWSLVTYEDLKGYVLTAKIALYNQEVTPEEEQIVRTITVTSNLEGVEEVYEGTIVTLTATLTGFEDVEYVMQWQYTPDGGQSIVDIEGANSSEYSFPITVENSVYLWRLNVTITGEIAEAEAAE